MGLGHAEFPTPSLLVGAGAGEGKKGDLTTARGAAIHLVIIEGEAVIK
jgi:hypothetical protein